MDIYSLCVANSLDFNNMVQLLSPCVKIARVSCKYVSHSKMLHSIKLEPVDEGLKFSGVKCYD